MLDTTWLAQTFSPAHLGAAALAAHRAAFAAHPAHVIHLDGVLAPHVAADVTRFLAAEAEFTTGHGLLT
ncbi:MAG: hypothetical protein KC635_01935, partial [Myxococcales bacterium]|nr:hypothetical protein [Myxococcales bacterium]